MFFFVVQFFKLVVLLDMSLITQHWYLIFEPFQKDQVGVSVESEILLAVTVACR